MADVVKVEHDNGDVSVGFEVEGVYVPVGTVSAARIAGLKERAASLSERLEADPDDKAVAEALSSLPTSVKSTSANKSTSTSKSEGGSS